MLLWLFPVIFAALYGLIGGVEFMLPLFGLLDSSEQTQKTISHWFSPVWEVTNVFFVAAITSFAAIFPLALPVLPDDLRLWLLIGGALLALRAALVLIFFYARGGAGRIFLSLLALVSLALPAALSQVILAVVLPNPDALQGIGAAIIGLALAFSLCSGLFCGLNRSHKRYQLFAQLGWAVAAAGFLLIGHGDFSLASVGIVFGCAALGAFATGAFATSRWIILGLSAGVYAVLAIELAVRQWPFVIFDKLAYTSAQAPSSIQAVIAWGSLAGLVIIGPPLVWLALIVVRRQQGKTY
jgi:cytochrome bd-type quinol oxidase subunit 2